MTKDEKLYQLDLIKGLIETKKRITVKFTFKYGKTLYELFGVYNAEFNVFRWELYKTQGEITEKIKYPESNLNTPLRILRFMDEFEWDVSKVWTEYNELF